MASQTTPKNARAQAATRRDPANTIAAEAAGSAPQPIETPPPAPPAPAPATPPASAAELLDSLTANNVAKVDEHAAHTALAAAQALNAGIAGVLFPQPNDKTAPDVAKALAGEGNIDATFVEHNVAFAAGIFELVQQRDTAATAYHLAVTALKNALPALRNANRNTRQRIQGALGDNSPELTRFNIKQRAAAKKRGPRKPKPRRLPRPRRPRPPPRRLHEPTRLGSVQRGVHSPNERPW
jgi:hypothetical protein